MTDQNAASTSEKGKPKTGKFVDTQRSAAKKGQTTSGAPNLDVGQKRHLRILIKTLAREGTKPTDKVTSEALQRSVWWWRYIENAFEIPGTDEPTEHGRVLMEEFGLSHAEIEWVELTILRCQQYPAFVYEIAVRLLEPNRIPIAWLKLPQSSKGKLIDAFQLSNPLLGTVSIGGPGTASPDSHWTGTVRNLTFNLLHSDSTLAEEFLSWFIRPERRRLGVPAPTANRGKRNRPFSWRPIELFDERRFEVKALDDGGRSQLNRAIREVETVLDLPKSSAGKTSK